MHQHGRQAPLIDKVPDSFLMESRSLPCFVEYVHLTLKCHGMPALISLFLCHTTYRFHHALTSSQFRCYVFSQRQNSLLDPNLPKHVVSLADMRSLP